MALLHGTVESGVGQGTHFMSLGWVRDGVREALGFDPYPGTLNLRLRDADALGRWREVCARDGRALVPPPSERCGGRLVPMVVAPDIPAAVIVPDVTRYGDDVLEVIAAVHLRSRLGLHDNDPVLLRCESS
jgi:riboflavin kinase